MADVKATSKKAQEGNDVVLDVRVAYHHHRHQQQFSGIRTTALVRIQLTAALEMRKKFNAAQEWSRRAVI
jgi:hypothetical protein